MKKLLELNERDNVFTAFAKGGVKGLMVSGAMVGVAAIIGKVIQGKTENSETEVEALDAQDEVAAADYAE